MYRLMTALAGASVFASLLLQVKTAEAASAPQVGAVPDWVRAPPAVPAEKEDVKGLPLTILLNDTQLSFDGDGWTEFRDIQAKVQASSGLEALGAIPFQWSPWSDTLTFHRARILRDGQSIDVLPKDGGFTVLRRETGLEQAMLTGELTALLQPEGLRVGDVLEIAISIRHADPLLKGRTGALLAGWDATPIGHMRLEAHWPSSLAVRWRETAGLPPLRRSDANGVTTVALDLEDVHPPVPPAHAPARFQHGREIEFSTLTGWEEVARTMAPLYAKAAELAPGSPLVAQARLIADASADPKVRAAAALHLVQDQVRYLAHAEAGGGYTPQTADDTWRLRYGDCKAKTALLLALLRELKVPAQPALASTTGGDGLDARLPSPLLFNHVLVRVTLGGRDYWLDGARQGDLGLDDMTPLAYGWVLPLDSAEGRLVHVGPAPDARPRILQVIHYDASGGVVAPEPTQLRTVFRGDTAVQLHAQLSAVPPDRLDAALKSFWAGVHTAFTPAHVAATWDPVTGEETVTADGTSKLDWSGSGLELQHVALGGAPDIKRDAASSDPDAPYALDYPSYVETDESVVLPPGIVLSAAILKTVDVDKVIAGTSYRRSASLSGNVFRVVASQRTLQPEVSAAEERAAVDPLTKLGELAIYAPAGPQAQAANDAAALDSQPTTLEGRLNRGNALLNAGRYREALTEFDAAIALDPKSQLAWADRAVAHAWLADSTAIADADKADGLGPPEIVAARARGILAANTGDANGALAAYRHALTLAPGDSFVLERLIDLEIRSASVEAGGKDLDDLVRAHPELAAGAHLWRASLEAAARHKDAAERELAQAPAASRQALLDRARIYLQLRDNDLARADVDASIRLEPTAGAWLLRASIDGGFTSTVANADVDEAIKLAPDDADPRLWLGAASARRDYTAALPLLDSLVKSHPELAAKLLVGRAQIDNALGRSADMDTDFGRARQLMGADAREAGLLCGAEVETRSRPEIALVDCEKALGAAPKSPELRMDKVLLLHRLGRDPEADAVLDTVGGAGSDAMQLNNVCYALAVENMKLERALADCDASLKLLPNNAAVLDSRGFVLMRLGRDAEALTAYDAALAANPKVYTSLYGRGLVEARLGRTTDSTRDIAAAVAAAPHLREDFVKMGLH